MNTEVVMLKRQEIQTGWKSAKELSEA